MIPTVAPITVKINPWNTRLHDLHLKCAAGTATKAELDELEARCRVFEADQDNRKEQDDGR